jgi:hypothetical protein
VNKSLIVPESSQRPFGVFCWIFAAPEAFSRVLMLFPFSDISHDLKIFCVHIFFFDPSQP